MFETSSVQWLLDDPLADFNRKKLELLSGGAEVIDLSMINPDLEPPRIMLDRLVEASLKSRSHRYSVSRGVKKLRESFAGLYERRFGVKVNSEAEVCVTMGTKDALRSALRCLATRGDKILVGAPTYPAHRYAIEANGLIFETFTIQADEQAMLNDIIARLAAGSYSMLLLNFPNNPTGICVSQDFYKKLGAALKNSQTSVINDFVYGEMGFESRNQPSLLADPELFNRSLESYSLSKAYNVPGWRIGALVGSCEAISIVNKYKAHIDYGVFLPLQIASAAALSANQDLVSPTSTKYNRRASLLCTGLRRLGWEVTMPQAGASVWAKLPDHVEGGSMAFATKLLDKAHCAVTPGVVFGADYDRFIRFALVASEELMHEVVERVTQVLAGT
jgi:alanine-synthesizing transaminase